MSGEANAVVTGIGQSQIGRHLERSARDLTLEAALAAISDAGLRRADIDGVSAYPGGEPPVFDIKDNLRLDLTWFDAGAEGPAQLRAFTSACMAVETGRARHVLVYRTVTMFGGDASETGTGAMTGSFDWLLPYHAYAAPTWFALYAQRFMHERSIHREQLAAIALNGRRNAALNPCALFRDPLTLDDYLGARMISTPLCLYDCDAACSGSTALIVSHPDTARDGQHTPVRVAAWSSALSARPSLIRWERMALWDAAEHLWRTTDLRPQDVDVAQLYDGFSTVTLEWLEALGLCPPREVGAFIEGGERISLTGELPLNTDGGMLSGGRLHGFNHLHEACVQLRGEGGARQVAGPPEVAVVGLGGGPIAGCALLTR
jgi:acetyl-CoA acetyltransferase